MIAWTCNGNRALNVFGLLLSVVIGAQFSFDDALDKIGANQFLLISLEEYGFFFLEDTALIIH